MSGSFIDKNPSNRNATNALVVYDASVTTSVPIAVGVYQARLVATTLCHYRMGGTGLTAVVTDPLLPANTIEITSVRPGEYFAFVKASGGTAGIATVTDAT